MTAAKKKVRKESRRTMNALTFLSVYTPAVHAGKSAKEIAQLLTDKANEGFEKKDHVSYSAIDVYQKSAMLRARLKKAGQNPDKVPHLSGESGQGRKSNVDELVELLDQLNAPAEVETETEAESKSEGESAETANKAE